LEDRKIRAKLPPFALATESERANSLSAVSSMIHGQNSLDTPLRRYGVLATADLEECRAHVADAYCDHRLDPVQRARRFDICHRRAVLPRVSLNYLRYGGTVAINPGSFDNFYMLEFPLSGSAQIDVDKERIVTSPGSMAILSPTARISSVWDESCEQLMVKIARPALEKYLVQMLGARLREPLTFAPFVAAETERRAGLRAFVTFLSNQMDGSPALQTNRQAMSALEEALFALMLNTLLHNYSDRLSARVAGIGPRHVKRVRDYIEERLEQSFTLSELVDVSEVSARTLYSSFERFVGLSPMAYVRSRRLDRVREELAAADPQHVRIADVAMKWGFSHLGRFSQEYHARFGELPSETLRT